MKRCKLLPLLFLLAALIALLDRLPLGPHYIRGDVVRCAGWQDDEYSPTGKAK